MNLCFMTMTMSRVLNVVGVMVAFLAGNSAYQRMKRLKLEVPVGLIPVRLKA